MKHLLRALCLAITCMHSAPAWSVTAQELYQQGVSLCKQEKYSLGIYCLQQADHLLPNNSAIQLELAKAFFHSGNIIDAINLYRIVLKKHPQDVHVRCNIAQLLRMSGYPDTAIHILEGVIAKNSDDLIARHQLLFAYLAKGDFKNGNKHHLITLESYGMHAPALRNLLANNTVAGKRILVEQGGGGSGDMFQHIRYAQYLHEMGAYVIVMAKEPVMPLLALCPYIDELLHENDQKPLYDGRLYVMNGTTIFDDTLETMPNTIPYLRADPRLVHTWRTQLGTHDKLRVGLCWQADLHNDLTTRPPISRRGIPLTKISALKDIDGINWYSLQRFDGVEQLTTIAQDFHVFVFDENFDQHHGRFMDTAAVITQMDVVISADTAIAHLAGAMGKRVFLLLPYISERRWLLKRADSPWYKTMRIFRQPKPFDWESVVQEVRIALQELV